MCKTLFIYVYDHNRIFCNHNAIGDIFPDRDMYVMAWQEKIWRTFSYTG